MYSSAWQKHKANQLSVAALCLGECVYCDMKKNAGTSAARWIVEYPKGMYKNAGKRRRWPWLVKAAFCGKSPRINSYRGR